MKHLNLPTTSEISRRMANVHLKNGKAEVLLAKKLWHLGYRYRLNYRKLPGSPDIALTKYKIAIFVDGEFWHGQNWEVRKSKIKSNKEYWIEKIEENIEHDKKVNTFLINKGWIPLRFWEKEILKNVDNCVQRIVESVHS